MIIKRLKHDATELTDAIIGWDIFWCRDYTYFDQAYSNAKSINEVLATKNKGQYGYTIIIALNTKLIKFFKRLFIRIK